MIAWWDKREENEVAWRVKVEDLKDGFDLDVKNPNQEFVETEHTSEELIAELKKSFARANSLVEKIAQSR